MFGMKMFYGLTLLYAINVAFSALQSVYVKFIVLSSHLKSEILKDANLEEFSKELKRAVCMREWEAGGSECFVGSTTAVFSLDLVYLLVLL